jgi:hypothetical protein
MSSTLTTSPQMWEDGLERLFEKIGDGLPVCWKEQERPYAPDGIILLRVIGDLSLGTDNYRMDIDTSLLTSSPPTEIQPTSNGNAVVTLQVQVETFDQHASGRARTFLRKIRQRLRLPSSIAHLKTIETSLAEILTVPVVDKLEDNRQYSLATMDVRLNTIQVENDVPFGRIDSIAIQPTLADEVGGAITTPPFTIDLPDP